MEGGDELRTLLAFLCWLGVVGALVVLAYPLISFLRSRLVRRTHTFTSGALPPVSIVLVGHNEAPYVKARVSGLLDDPDLPSGSELIIVNDASTDDMANELHAFRHDERVRIETTATRSSKAASLNQAVALARHEFLFFCDWRQPMDQGSLAHLLVEVRRPRTGVACARLVDDLGNGRGSWTRRLFAAMNRWDSRDGGCMNIHGACYAQRRSCFRPLPTDIIFDDLYVVASTHAQGMAVVQVETAVIHDVPFERYYGPERIMRLTRGLLLFLYNHHRLMWRMGTARCLRLLHCKYGKLLLPFLLLMMVPWCVVALVQAPSMWAWTAAPVLLVLVVPWLRRWCWTFVRFQWYVGVAVLRFTLFGHRTTRWQKLRTH